MNHITANRLKFEAYNTAKAKGFHDHPFSPSEKIVLMISELSEMLEAHRKGHQFTAPAGQTKARFIYNLKEIASSKNKEEAENFLNLFKQHQKDTIEDELSDVIIRLFDYAGAIGHTFEELKNNKEYMYEQMTTVEFPQKVLKLMVMFTDYYKTISNTTIWDKIRRIFTKKIGMDDLLWKLIDFSQLNGIDIGSHIYLKMKFNETRDRMHGKKY